MKKKFVMVMVTAFSLLIFPNCVFADGVVESLGQADRPIWRIGHTWKYRIDRSSEKTLTMIVQEITSDGGYTLSYNNKMLVFCDHDLNVIKKTNNSGNILEEGGAGMFTYKWPLKTGKHWSGSFFSNRGNGLITLNVEVEGEEILTTVSGQKVPTIKLVSKYDSSHKQTFAKFEYWYNPKVENLEKQLPKRISGSGKNIAGIMELISFTPGR